MAIEIERKFLVNKQLWEKNGHASNYQQAYLAKGGCTLRVRITDEDSFITIKGPTVGFSREEFEYSIPKEDAKELMKLALYPPIKKVRYKEEIDGKVWEVDEFFGTNEGLIVAEIELTSELETFTLPHWIGREVTGLSRYNNAALSRRDFGQWTAEERR